MRSFSIATTAGLLAAAFASSAVAQEEGVAMSPFSSIDAYLTYSDLQSDGAVADVDDAEIGGGLRLRMGLGDLFFIDGGFQSVNIDNPELASGGKAQDATVRFREQHISGGLRLAFFEETLIPYITVGEYRPRVRVNAPTGNARFSESGLIYGAGVDYNVLPGLHIAAQYRLADDLGDAEFEEITGEVAYRLAGSLAVFAAYRQAEIDFDGGGSFDSDDIRLGFRFSFAAEDQDGGFY